MYVLYSIHAQEVTISTNAGKKKKKKIIDFIFNVW